MIRRNKMHFYNHVAFKVPTSSTFEFTPYGITKFNKLLRKKNNYQVVKQYAIKYPEVLQIPDNEGWLPLHFACWYCQSLDIIQMLLRLHPKAAEKQNTNGWLPLHLATFYNLPFDIICLLLEAYPKAAEISQKDGYLPLHLACYNQSSIGTTKLLLAAYPKATETKNIHGDLPLHIACMVDQSSHELIQMLVDAYPKATEVQNKYGDLPVHWACHKNASIDIINMLFDAYPQSLTRKNKSGWLPQDVAANTEVKFLAKKGKLPIPDVNLFDKKIYIKNRTGRQLKIEFHHLSLQFQNEDHEMSHSDNDCGIEACVSRKQGNLGNGGVIQDVIVEPNMKMAFPVPKGCKGIYFNILCYSDTSMGWVLNHFIHGGRTQQVTGQPFQIRGE